ncbi:MAG: hypothetical protein EPO61_13865 [Nitrospirae bacterium]|nr:MAG: hypothetical protein EPO61_13865 [Nitrospirota bacterium]
MPLIWCSISGHGFGHAAQVAPVLNELGKSVSGIKALLRTTLPRQFFEGFIQIPWELTRQQQDVGCVQEGPLHIDHDATWAETQRFHDQWETRVEEETRAILARSPAMLLSNISHLAVEAGARAGLPTIAMSSLSWDQILEPLMTPGDIRQAGVLQQIKQAYSHADLLIRVTPGMPFPAFPNQIDIAPIVRPLVSDRARLNEELVAQPDDCLVLIGFGGIALNRLPFSRLNALQGYRFIVGESVPSGYSRLRSAKSLPLSFDTLMASADMIVTKPGYNMTVEAVAMGKPTLYVRRYDFAEEEYLVQFLHQYGRALQLSMQDFEAGHWGSSLDTLRALPAPLQVPPSPTGAAEAAEILASYLR